MHDRDGFFVGYLPTPTALHRWTLAVAGCALLVMITAAIVIAAGQRDPGDGRWDTATRQVEGVYVDSPYPMLHTDDATLLLVGEGKVAGPREVSLRDQRVRAAGTILKRGAVQLLELGRPVEPLRSDEQFPAIAMPSATQTLRGEILDPKCFAGAMKPGDGKTHKGCAALCLRGGIPPVFRSGDELYLLVDQDLKRLEGAALQRVIEQVGEDVTVVGGLTSIGRLKVLAVDAGTIRRRAP